MQKIVADFIIYSRKCGLNLKNGSGHGNYKC